MVVFVTDQAPVSNHAVWAVRVAEAGASGRDPQADFGAGDEGVPVDALSLQRTVERLADGVTGDNDEP
ncbi:hypothetical protein [Streptomyces cadmiisoli]|uniref:hypothetical protein n=1 Tax=Streptomyces cadmiisoli TaxID=2184053 RepID=UPI0013A6C762|nr:hypothetical protein [Streptomyces cadmiisoli]